MNDTNSFCARKGENIPEMTALERYSVEKAQYTHNNHWFTLARSAYGEGMKIYSVMSVQSSVALNTTN